MLILLAWVCPVVVLVGVALDINRAMSKLRNYEKRQRN